MKNMITFLTLVALASCSNQITVRTDFDKSVNISSFNSFTWLDKHGIEERNNPLYYNELNDKRIKEAVLGQLQGKGYALSEEKPKLRVHYHIVIEDKTQVRTDVYSPYWINNQRDVYRYREGTLIVDLMDAEKEALLWRGWAIAALSDTEQMSDELISEAIAKIIEKLPKAEPVR